jgi:hypothetical protein
VRTTLDLSPGAIRRLKLVFEAYRSQQRLEAAESARHRLETLEALDYLACQVGALRLELDEIKRQIADG